MAPSLRGGGRHAGWGRGVGTGFKIGLRESSEGIVPAKIPQEAPPSSGSSGWVWRERSVERGVVSGPLPSPTAGSRSLWMIPGISTWFRGGGEFSLLPGLGTGLSTRSQDCRTRRKGDPRGLSRAGSPQEGLPTNGITWEKGPGTPCPLIHHLP